MNNEQKNIITISNKVHSKKNKSYIKTIKNPLISYINRDSHFIYSELDAKIQFNYITNKNLIKPTKDEIDLLKDVIKKINEQKLLFSEKNELLDIPIVYAEQISKFIPESKKEKNILIEFIVEILNNNQNRQALSCRKIASLYQMKYGKKVGKSTIHRIMRNQLDYRYLKTSYKTKKIENIDNKLYSFYFIKAIAKFIKTDFELVFLDESKIELINNHYKCWRRKEESIFFSQNKKQKQNLILAITRDDIVYYEILDNNVNSNVFIKFIDNLANKLDSQQNHKFVLVMDNCTSHNSNDTIEYLDKRKINVIFTPPYQSIFTPIELAFRALKKKTYSKIYTKMDEIIEDIQNFLSSKDIKKTLMLNFKETVEQYINYDF